MKLKQFIASFLLLLLFAGCSSGSDEGGVPDGVSGDL